ncbi:MAG TPA: hypothetical protein VFA33_19935 [Bryobacteraceae bacterium]|nr:hypothetical protein [Bryobacteraceae bacterium]
MSKTATTRESVLKSTRERNGFRDDEILAAVCNYFCAGSPVAQILQQVEEKLHVRLSREEPYRLLALAASRGWLQFDAPLAINLEDTIRKRCPWLETATVVRTGVSEDISYHVARMLLEMVQALCRRRGQPSDVHIGFAGGRSLRKTARWFAEMLREPAENLPRRIVFHAMVAGVNFKDPTTEPNAFFTYFAGEPPLQVQTSFVGLHAPGIINTSRIEELRSIDSVREAYEGVKQLDIVVTAAGGHWQEGHSGLYAMYQASPRSLEQLTRAGCVGDMMWRPLGPAGPLEIKTEIRTLTLMEISELPGFIRQGRQVLLLLGPCGQCGGPKSEVLRAILSHQPPLITHLVADSRSVRGLRDSA